MQAQLENARESMSQVFDRLSRELGDPLLQQIADELVAAGVVLEGPVMGPLTRAETRDGCHANEAGQVILGRQLLDFFG